MNECGRACHLTCDLHTLAARAGEAGHLPCVRVGLRAAWREVAQCLGIISVLDVGHATWTLKDLQCRPCHLRTDGGLSALFPGWGSAEIRLSETE